VVFCNDFSIGRHLPDDTQQKRAGFMGMIQPLVVIVGSRRAGRITQLERLAEDLSGSYRPVITLTDRSEPKEHDDRWYRRVTRAEIGRTPSNQFFTFFKEGEWYYAILRDDVTLARANHATPIVGMTPRGLEYLYERSERISETEPHLTIDFRAVVLVPEDADDFSSRLMREYGLSPDEAWDETERAVRLSTLPPGINTPSVVPLPVRGGPEDAQRLDQLLAEILPK
jgi:hypothetical protein